MAITRYMDRSGKVLLTPYLVRIACVDAFAAQRSDSEPFYVSITLNIANHGMILFQEHCSAERADEIAMEWFGCTDWIETDKYLDPYARMHTQ